MNHQKLTLVLLTIAFVFMLIWMVMVLYLFARILPQKNKQQKQNIGRFVIHKKCFNLKGPAVSWAF